MIVYPLSPREERNIRWIMCILTIVLVTVVTCLIIGDIHYGG